MSSSPIEAPIFDENNNTSIDLNSVKLLEFQAARELEEVDVDDVTDSSNVSEAGSNQAYSVSTTSFPPDDPDRIFEVASQPEEAVPKLRCKVKKLEAEVDSLKDQLSRINIREDLNGNIISSLTSNSSSVGGGDERSRQEREKCVVLKCIPQAHVANEIIITRISEFFKIPSEEITVQVTDQLNKWCVVVLQTPSRHHATTILRKFSEFRKLYHCYHRTQALPCFSNSERQKYQQLWAEAIERNNRAGYRSWEVDPSELRLIETVGIPQKWRVKVHYYPENDSLSASTSAIEVRRRQRGLQSPKNGNESDEIRPKPAQLMERRNSNNNNNNNNNKHQQQHNRNNNHGEKKQPFQQRHRNSMPRGNNRKQNNSNYNSSGYEYLDCIPQHAYVPHHPHHQYVTSFHPHQNSYFVPNHIYNSMQFYSQHLPLESNPASSAIAITSASGNVASSGAAPTTSSGGNVFIITPTTTTTIA